MKSIISSLLLILAFTSCAVYQSENYTLLTSNVYQQKLSEPNVQLVDVRTSAEFGSGHLAGAINIDINKDDFSDRIKVLDNSRKVFIYCRSGVRSNKAAKRMQELGFKEIYDLEGGILAWGGKLVK